jgi:argininosuccinate lyase
MKKLWGTRFAKKTSSLADKFSSSISFDKKLAVYDANGSIAHAKMLGKCKIINPQDAKKIIKGLQAILKQIQSGSFKFDPKAEDIHSNIQDVLKKKIGPSADKLHTARSRNDQIALDMKMYCLDEGKIINQLIKNLQKSIFTLAVKNKEVIIPAYTHLQPAQVVLLAHHLLAYLEMLERDMSRLIDTSKRTNEMPLGSCALSGTSLPIDRIFVCRELGFNKITANSIDSISDRDFVMEILADITILSVHLSRIAEDLILWSTREFDFIEIDWSFCTGSSIMPHKKNPDILELIRATVGEIHGNLSSVLIMMKGLPLSYNRDMQFDKPPLFNSIDTIKEILIIFNELFKKITINKTVIIKKISDEALFSVDIMEYLIKKGVPYREAHDIVGKIVKKFLDKGKALSDIDIKEFKKFSKAFSSDVKKLLNPKTSVGLKKSQGGTSPERIAIQIEIWKNKLYA